MNINLVIPCYNEEEILYDSIKVLLDILIKNKYSNNFQITLIDDGSIDNTWSIIKKLHNEDKHICGIKFSQNYGHLAALNAGFKENNFEHILMLDADFMIEFPKNLVDQLIENMSKNDHDIIQVVRKKYFSSFFKKSTSNMFYFVFNILSNVKIISSAPDFRIINSKVCEKLSLINHKIFFRREIHAYNFKIKLIYAEQKTSRKSKFTLLKMLSFAFESLLFNTGFMRKKNNYKILERT